jgi:hypothetical protein
MNVHRHYTWLKVAYYTTFTSDPEEPYFDKQGIREKSIEVGEKLLFDLFYDYDSNFAHGL